MLTKVASIFAFIEIDLTHFLPPLLKVGNWKGLHKWNSLGLFFI